MGEVMDDDDQRPGVPGFSAVWVVFGVLLVLLALCWTGQLWVG
jgi:hypothetical protein